LFEEIIKRKHLSEKNSAFILRQVLSAITYCHSKGVVHRDLKPENVLIDSIQENGLINVKIIDFGTALFFSKDTEINETLGTPYYVAPEVLLGNYTEKCDIKSIGVIMYILLCGSPPFNGKSDEEIMNAVKKGAYSFKNKVWESISPEAKDLIKQMLAYNPEERISAINAYANSWIQSKEFKEVSEEKTKEIMSNMGKFIVKYAICN